jgi:hypothetical protein
MTRHTRACSFTPGEKAAWQILSARARRAWVSLIALVTLACAQICPEGTHATLDFCVSTPKAPPVTYVKAPYSQELAHFGRALALDGSSLVVGAPFEAVNVNREAPLTDCIRPTQPAPCQQNAGAAYLFKSRTDISRSIRIIAPNADARDGEATAEITPADFRGEDQKPQGGLVVALDQDLVVVSATGEDSGDPAQMEDNTTRDAGAVYVYDHDGIPLQYLKAPAPHELDLFGLAVALSDSWLAVGAPGDDVQAADSGVVYVYKRNPPGSENGVFALPPRRVKAQSPMQSALFGRVVKLEGSRMIVSAPLAEGPGGERAAGRVYVYQESGDEWTEEAEVLSPFPILGGFFGLSLALSGDRFAIGAPGAGACGANEELSLYRGAVYVVSKAGDGWSVGPCLAARTGGKGTGFGGDVALLGDQLAIGAPWDENGLGSDDKRPLSGAVYLYEYSAAQGFKETKYIKAPNARPYDVFGVPVVLAPGLLGVGAHLQSGRQTSIAAMPEKDQAYQSGAAYLFNLADL